MKAFLIDPTEQSIKEVDCGKSIDDIYKLIDADCFTSVRIDRKNYVYVDDNGLICTPPKEDFFTLSNYPQPLAGKGLVLGCDFDGETIGATVTMEYLLLNVRFPKVRHTGFVTSEGAVDDPLFGKMIKINRVATFEAKEEPNVD